MDVNIKFLQDCDPEDGGPVFVAGSTAKLNPASAHHWIRRRKAVEITAKQAKAIDDRQAKQAAEAEKSREKAEKDAEKARKKAEKDAEKQAKEKK